MAECHIHDKSTMPCSMSRRCVVYMAFGHDVLTPGLLSEDRESLGIAKLSTMDWTGYFSPFLSVFFALIQFSVSELTPEQCRELGFSVNLLCSSCDELKPFNLTSEPSLEANCRKCCHADEQEEATKVWIALFSSLFMRVSFERKISVPF